MANRHSTSANAPYARRSYISTYYTRRLVLDARDTAQRQLRAYVLLDAVEIRKFRSSEPIEAVAHIKNTGQTPAYGVSTWFSITAGTFPQKSFPSLNTGRYPSDIGPGGHIETSVRAPRVLTSDEQDNIVRGDSAVYGEGDVRYIDAFKNQHVSKFRHMYRGNGIAPAPGSVLQLSGTEEGNSAD